MLKHRLHINSSRAVAGRKCIVKKISTATARTFVDRTHISGFASASIHLGLYYGDELVSVFSVRNASRFEAGVAELVRLSFSCMVHGALGKFLLYLRVNYSKITKLVSYADLRYGRGDIYKNNNFKIMSVTKPGFWYYYNNTMYHRLSWQKKKLVNMGFDPALSANAIMDSLGAIRIYDAGHIKYQLEIKHDSR